MYATLSESFNSFLNNLIDKAPNLISALVILIAVILLGKLFYSFFIKRIKSRIKDILLAGFIAQVGKWIVYLFGVLAALHVLGFGTFAASLLTGAGISAIIIGFAFKDIAENFLAGILLAINRPFNIGDIIEADNYKGTVKNLEIRTTHIRTVDGRDIYIPNSSIIKSSLVNFTKDGLLRMDFIVGLATEADIEEVRKLILNKLNGREGILTTPPANVIVENIGVSSIDIKVLFWIDILKSKTEKADTLGHPIRSQVIREVKDLLLEHGYNLPSYVVEHKMYDSKIPITVSLSSDK